MCDTSLAARTERSHQIKPLLCLFSVCATISVKCIVVTEQIHPADVAHLMLMHSEGHRCQLAQHIPNEQSLQSLMARGMPHQLYTISMVSRFVGS